MELRSTGDLGDIQQCSRCVYNSGVFPSLTFDSAGICSSCREYDRVIQYRVHRGAKGAALLDERITEIKRQGKGKEYDCIIGVSGGTDSTYTAYLVKQLGLRPLAVHFDNGWNSELAVKNIHQSIAALEIDLETYVMDWPQFRDLQLAFLRASTPDGEVPTDHAIGTLMWKSASKVGIKTIISGMNYTTESATDPIEWAYGHSDWRYIKDVHKKFGTMPIPDFPHFSLSELLYINSVKRVRTMSVLNYIDYDKHDAQRVLAQELGWRDYGGKHHESIYTRFFQGYLLPKKFGIDKRYSHLSDLVRCGQISREDALRELDSPPYDPELQLQDREYVCKKLGLSDSEFEGIMNQPIRSFHEFKNNFRNVYRMKRAVNVLRSRGLYDV